MASMQRLIVDIGLRLAAALLAAGATHAALAGDNTAARGEIKLCRELWEEPSPSSIRVLPLCEPKAHKAKIPAKSVIAPKEASPSSCLSSTEPAKGTMCKEELTVTVTNVCVAPIDMRICMTKVNGKWDCRAKYGVKPGKTGLFGWCGGSGRVFEDFRYSPSNSKFKVPPPL